MDDFKNKFIEEASDLINKLEDTLLTVEKSSDIGRTVDEIFRVMHSLKGGGAMFGFDNISEFTHNLENIYDLVRNGKMELTKKLLDLTFASVDHLKLLLVPGSEKDVAVQLQHKELARKVLDLYVANTPNPSSQDKAAEGKHAAGTYFISFDPKPEILYDGTNPMYLIDELCTLGQYKVFSDLSKVPEIDTFDPEKCYCKWNILLVSEEPLSSLQDVFIFVEADSNVQIKLISEKNLLQDSRFLNSFDKIIEFKKFVHAKDVEDILQTLSDSDISGGFDDEPKQSLKRKLEASDSLITSIRVSSEKLDSLLNLVSELVTTQASLSLYADLLKNHEMTVIAENVENLTRQLRDVAFSISLVPIETVVTRFNRLVRDLSSEFNKDILFITEGIETELDKTLIQNITEPLMHIIRNSVDHGIESKEERIAKGKSSQGRIVLKSYYSGTNVIIEITDDGRGINPERIKQSAIKKGFINANAVFTEKEIQHLIFMPGFSTAATVTDISGRGVGMDVVKRRIMEVRGDVEIESKIDRGTTVRLKLPLTLSIIDGLLVDVGAVKYIVPMSSIDKIYSVDTSEVDTINKNQIVLDGERYPCFNLRKEFSYPQNTSQNEQIIIVNFNDAKVGLVVDQVIGEVQAVLKSLGKHYRRLELISGATILGDGSIALVLDTNKAIKRFSNLND